MARRDTARHSLDDGRPGHRLRQRCGELYDLNTDFTEADDLAARHPDKLKELQAAFDEEARRYNVFPLDDRMAGASTSQPTEPAGRVELHLTVPASAMFRRARDQHAPGLLDHGGGRALRPCRWRPRRDGWKDVGVVALCQDRATDLLLQLLQPGGLSGVLASPCRRAKARSASSSLPRRRVTASPQG